MPDDSLSDLQVRELLYWRRCTQAQRRSISRAARAKREQSVHSGPELLMDNIDCVALSGHILKGNVK